MSAFTRDIKTVAVKAVELANYLWHASVEYFNIPGLSNIIACVVYLALFALMVHFMERLTKKKAPRPEA
jgi:hypothetical protein